jgi:hypothetical protein
MLPSAEIEGIQLMELPCVPPESTLTRSISRGPRTKTSQVPLLSPETRLVAMLENATWSPSAEIAAR